MLVPSHAVLSVSGLRVALGLPACESDTGVTDCVADFRSTEAASDVGRGLSRARRTRAGAPPRWARRHRGLIPFRRLRVSNLHPAQPRRRRGFERQRLAAVEHIRLGRELIRAAAARYGIAAEAIAGAVLWDALENPYKRPFLRLGPGKVRPSRLGGPSAAELAERAGLVPFSPASALARWRLLQRPDSAIIYISAILASHAADYREIAGVEISGDPALLCTLYQGGGSAERARRLADRRLLDPGAMPHAADEMGPWVAEHIDFVRAALRAGPSSPPKGQHVRRSRRVGGSSASPRRRSPA